MKEITFTVNDELGLHARPAGLLVKEVSGYTSAATISCRDKSVDAKRIMGVMGLGVKQGDTITMTFTGDDEEAAAAAVEKFLSENL